MAQKVKIDFDRNFDFSKTHRYRWRTHPIFEKHPELRDEYSTAIQVIMNTTNQQLMAKGFQPVSCRTVKNGESEWTTGTAIYLDALGPQHAAMQVTAHNGSLIGSRYRSGFET